MLKQKQLEIEQERIKSQALIAAGQGINQAAMNQAKLKSQRIQKGGEILAKAVEKDAQFRHEKNAQARDHLHNMMSAEQQAILHPAQPKKESKE